MHAHQQVSLNRLAVAATWHCLSGCAIGEILGLVIATALGWGNFSSIALAVVLAFFFGYSLTLRPLVAGGVPLRRAARVALAADTLSITVMEIVDNGFVLLVPGGHGGRSRRPSVLVEPRRRSLHRLLGGASGQPAPDRPRPRSRRGARVSLAGPARA